MLKRINIFSKKVISHNFKLHNIHKKKLIKYGATDDYPETRIVIDVCSVTTDWKPIIFISASDISFNLIPVDPDNIYFFKMEK